MTELCKKSRKAVSQFVHKLSSVNWINENDSCNEWGLFKSNNKIKMINLVIFIKTNRWNILLEQYSVINSIIIYAGEHYSDEYKKINPFSLVPAIDDDGFRLTERYLIKIKTLNWLNNILMNLFSK